MMQDNIITLSLRPDVTVLAVPVDPGSYSFCQFYFKESYEVGGLSFYNAKTYQTSRLPLPPGSYELIGLLREFKDAEELAVLNTAIHSAGGDPKQNWLIITKK